MRGNPVARVSDMMDMVVKLILQAQALVRGNLEVGLGEHPAFEEEHQALGKEEVSRKLLLLWVPSPFMLSRYC